MENDYTTDLVGISYLRAKLFKKRDRVRTRYEYYEMKNREIDFGISTPPELSWFRSVLGWCAKAVDSLADRLVFDEMDNDTFDMNEIFRNNSPDILFDSAVLSACISSCCFIYISEDEVGYPRLQVIDGSNATGTIDPITGLLREGYAVLDRDEMGAPKMEAYFLPERTEFYQNGELYGVYRHECKYPLLVPIVYRPDAKRPFGHSRISRACMSLVGSAIRTIKRSEIAAEFYSYPQKYVTGLSNDAEQLDKWRATMSTMMAFTKDEDGDSPKLGQFTQQSMAPHNEQLKMFASMFAGETGLTMDDLGFATGNPSSAEAIKAAHENLRLTARKAQRTFGYGFLNVGMLACSVRDGIGYERKAFYQTKPVWEPVFEPDAAMLSQIGDGAIKLNQAIPNFMDEKKIKNLTGI